MPIFLTILKKCKKEKNTLLMLHRFIGLVPGGQKNKLTPVDFLMKILIY